MEKYLGEFLGTLVLIAFGTSFGASITLKGALSKGMNPNWLTVAFGWGFAVMLGVFTAGAFNTGGHLNPAVTIAFALGGMFDWSMVAGYIIAQVLGAVAGAVVTFIHYYPHFLAQAEEAENPVGIFGTGPAIPNPLFNFLSETVATFFFIFCLLFVTKGEIAPGFTPLLVAFLVVAIGLSFGSTTGYAINPARDFGPRLAFTLLPIPNKGDANWGYAWVPIVGPILGATLAVFIFQALTAGM